MAGSIVDFIAAGNGPISVIGLPCTLECRECTGTRKACVSTTATSIVPLDLAVPLIARFASDVSLRARLGRELPILVERLVACKELATLGALSARFPLSAAPVIAEAIDFNDVDWCVAVNASGIGILSNFLRGGVLAIDPGPFVCGRPCKSVAEARDQQHLMAYSRWTRNEPTNIPIKSVIAAVRLLELPADIVAIICRHAKCLPPGCQLP